MRKISSSWKEINSVNFQPCLNCINTQVTFLRKIYKFLKRKKGIINLLCPYQISRVSPGGMIVSYLCAQLAVPYTYNSLLIIIYYRLGQNLLIINKYAVRSRYSLGQGLRNRREIQLTRFALPYDYACFADGISFV